MRIWTTQSKEVWDLLQAQGTVSCDTYRAEMDFYREGYDWMVEQMVRRIGPPPRPDIRYPLWGWRQVGNYRKEYHGRLADCSGNGDEFVFITAEIPDDRILLSDFELWHCVLNHFSIPMTRQEERITGEDFLIRSWERVFDLDTRFGYAPRMRRNRDIQATFWELRLEWVTSSSRLTGYQEWQRRKREKEETPE
jgi:hypothetical protein